MKGLSNKEKAMIKLKLMESKQKNIQKAKEEIELLKKEGKHKHAEKMKEQCKEIYNYF